MFGPNTDVVNVPDSLTSSPVAFPVSSTGFLLGSTRVMAPSNVPVFKVHEFAPLFPSSAKGSKVSWFSDLCALPTSPVPSVPRPTSTRATDLTVSSAIGYTAGTSTLSGS